MDNYTRRLDQPAASDHPTHRLDDPEWAPTRCPKCGGMRVWAAAVPTGTYAGTVVLQRLAGEGWGGQRRGQRRRTTCAALVCGECGLTEFYAHRPKDLFFEGE